MNHEIKTNRLPPWFKVPLGSGERYRRVRNAIATHGLHTVCSSARCPNSGECWNSGTAAFMILGDICTRNCGFCAIDHGIPSGLETTEPQRVSAAVKALGLSYVVVTSVTRDDLEDGGASVFAEVIRVLRKEIAEVAVEVLIPDFMGCERSLAIVLDAQPDILNHNIETVRELYSIARPQANYDRSLQLLSRTSRSLGQERTKSGIMVGLGETRLQLRTLFADLLEAGTGRLTIGQYLQPTGHHLPVNRYVTPPEFEDMRAEALKMGFYAVSAGPLVRSSYHAAEQS